MSHEFAGGQITRCDQSASFVLAKKNFYRIQDSSLPQKLARLLTSDRQTCTSSYTSGFCSLVVYALFMGKKRQDAPSKQTTFSVKFYNRHWRHCRPNNTTWRTEIRGKTKNVRLFEYSAKHLFTISKIQATENLDRTRRWKFPLRKMFCSTSFY